MLEDWNTQTVNRNAREYSIIKGCGMFKENKIQRVELKHTLCKGATVSCREDPDSWKCDVCDRTLRSTAVYVSHVIKPPGNPQTQGTYSNALSSPENTTCELCGKVGRIISVLKRHMRIYNSTSRFGGYCE